MDLPEGAAVPNSGNRTITYMFGPDGNDIALIDPNAVGVIGDYNNNSIVDIGDYALWRDKLGTSFQLQNEDPNTTPGQVTLEDYGIWSTRFGATTGSGTSVAIPEPTGLALWLLGCGIALGAIRRHALTPQ